MKRRTILLLTSFLFFACNESTHKDQEVSHLTTAVKSGSKSGSKSESKSGSKSKSKSNEICKAFCNSVFRPGKSRGECISQGAKGQGPCFEGYCVPAAEGDYGTDVVDTKIADLLSTQQIPSAMAGGLYQMLQRFIAGETPATDLEAAVFPVLEAQSTESQELLGCAVRRVSNLAPEERAILFAEPFAELNGDPVSEEALSTAVLEEIRQRLSTAAFGETDTSVCVDNERPGEVRDLTDGCFDIDRGSFDGPCPLICRMDASSLHHRIRTVGFRPHLTAAERDDVAEIERTCSLDSSGDPYCTNVPPPNCSGDTDHVEDLCLVVPIVEQGDNVLLEGINFSSVDTTVLLHGIPPNTVQREVEAHVCGDANAGSIVSPDCNTVSDILTFEVPSDMPTGIYKVTVKVPDPTSPSSRLQTFFDSPTIQVIPPSDTPYELSSVELACIDESGWTDWGEDEVELRITTIPVNADFTLGETNSESFPLSHVNSGDRRLLNEVHFAGAAGAGMIFSIHGWEVDNREAFERGITAFDEAWELFRETTWNEIADTVGDGAGGLATIFGLGQYSNAIDDGIEFSWRLFWSIWAPADLLIEDGEGITNVQLSTLTSINHDVPPPRYETSLGGVEIEVLPCAQIGECVLNLTGHGEVGLGIECNDDADCGSSARCDFPTFRTETCPEEPKSIGQYHERREYRHSDATYQVILKYNRLLP